MQKEETLTRNSAIITIAPHTLEAFHMQNASHKNAKQ